MRRVVINERADWRASADALGFAFHTVDGDPYWDESAYYAFTLDEIEKDIEAPTESIHEMAMDLVGEIVRSEALLAQLAIPQRYWEWIAESWRDASPHLYGRMDFAYDGHGPAKLFELNYDTPTSLYEAAFFQWHWLEQQRERGALPKQVDQFNRIQEALIETFGTIAPRLPTPFYLAAVRQSREDQATIAYLQDCAEQAGIATKRIAIEDIGLSSDGRFTDMDDNVIRTLFKLYPLEFMFEERFGPSIPDAKLVLIEPPWKSVLSNKGVLPLLWERHKDHPNLLPSFFEDASNFPLEPGWVRKPFFSREGANIDIRLPDGSQVATDGPYDDSFSIRQQFHSLSNFGAGYTLVGSWVVADRAVGIGIREDTGLITKDTSRFLPHVIL